jgi:hypothetical protein
MEPFSPLPVTRHKGDEEGEDEEMMKMTNMKISYRRKRVFVSSLVAFKKR